MSLHDFMLILHLILFVYWLGADLGVFYAAKFVARSDLTVEERHRFLELTLLIDMGPRTGLTFGYAGTWGLWHVTQSLRSRGPRLRSQ